MRSPEQLATTVTLSDELLALLNPRRGHFLLESGHHGELWLDLDALLLRPRLLRRFAVELARRLSANSIDAVCGPLVGGAFVAEVVAAELDVEFYYAARSESARVDPQAQGARIAYRIPDALRRRIRDRSVAIVDDVINVGSAVRATLADIQQCGGRPAAIAALLVLGDPAGQIAAQRQIPLETIGTIPNTIWPSAACPPCAAGVTLTNVPLL